MSTIPAIAALVAALLFEPANPNIELFNMSGYKRAPIVAADKKAADLPGPAAVWNGSAWWQVLTYCSAMHGVQAVRVRAAAGDVMAETPESKAESTLSTHYLELALDRAAADRGISKDKAYDDLVDPEQVYWSDAFVQRPMNYRLEALTCRFAESRSKA